MHKGWSRSMWFRNRKYLHSCHQSRRQNRRIIHRVVLHSPFRILIHQDQVLHSQVLRNQVLRIPVLRILVRQDLFLLVQVRLDQALRILIHRGRFLRILIHQGQVLRSLVRLILRDHS